MTKKCFLKDEAHFNADLERWFILFLRYLTFCPDIFGHVGDS